MTKPVNVVCMWWRREDGTEKFGLEYVNRLYRMVEKNLTIPHRFVCFTEDTVGHDGTVLDAGIEHFPLPPVKLRGGLPERGWKKLGMLSKKLGDLTGTALFLDLDTVIVDNIDALFEQPGEFIIARDTKNNDEVGNSSVFRFVIGKHADILDNFEKNSEQIRTEVRHEQAYMSREMRRKGIFSFWNEPIAGAHSPGPDDKRSASLGGHCAPNTSAKGRKNAPLQRPRMCESWCVSFKYCCLLPFPFNWFVAPGYPRTAKVIIFHGRPNNEQAMNGFTAKFGLRRVRPTKWIRKYWIGE
ncbi:MAG: glycosyltransferase [Proteobacteria bacterium]|nr:glycosyltransferase [Pseudomonadota bacterium]